jgi:hypothetical protein
MDSVVTPPGERLGDLLTRLGELEDKHALASLMNRYVLAVDSFDWDAWGKCWAPDAVADFGRHGLLAGREAIVTASRSGRTIYEDRGGMQHVVVNLEFDVDGDCATGSGNLLYARTLDSARQAPDRAIGGRYRWTFARGREGWQIARAELHRTWTADRDVPTTA